ncbi:MAG TPA: class II aldolase/adducin family protein [Polyangiaceae bacterium]|nr:class II aldolase/adducin family protein [Polyangiaceae bacterium]
MTAPTDPADSMVARAMNSLYRRGYARTGGNVSVKRENRIFITPSGASRDFGGRLRRVNIVECDVQGKSYRSQPNLSPSREIGIHCLIYAQLDWATSIIHAHAAEVIAAAMMFDSVPALTESAHKFPEILVIKNTSTLGTSQLLGVLSSELSLNWFRAMHRPPYGACVLVERHGLFVAGETLGHSLYFLEKLVENARIALAMASRAAQQ